MAPISRAILPFLFAELVLWAASPIHAQSEASTGPSIPGQPIPGITGVSPFAGSVSQKLISGVIPLSLQTAIDLGLKQNLGALLSNADIHSARGQRWQQLSALLPQVTAAPAVADSKINLGQLGFTSISGLNIPVSLGPFSYFDARVAVSQSLFDWKSINATRAATQNLKSAEYTFKDARDLVVLAVGYTYLQAIADEARIATAEAQVETAGALYKQASDQVTAGTSPEIDGLRAKVELQTRQQQLIQAKNNFEIQKLTVARVYGFAPGQEFDLTDKSPYQPFESVPVDVALKRAYASRSDYLAAMPTFSPHNSLAKPLSPTICPRSRSMPITATVAPIPLPPRPSMTSKARSPSPSFRADASGATLEADARLEQSRERLDNLRAQIDADVRDGIFNLESSTEQVKVARSNIDLAEETLLQSRDRFTAGVTDTVEVVQSQELVASAHEQYISSLYSYNFAKISLARALGIAESAVKQYFKGQ